MIDIRNKNYIIVILSIVLFIIAIAIKKTLGVTSYLFLAISSPPLIISSIVNSSIFFYLILFLYYLFTVWIGYVCLKKGKISFIIMSICLLILHSVSYLYTQKAFTKIGYSLIEQFMKP